MANPKPNCDLELEDLGRTGDYCTPSAWVGTKRECRSGAWAAPARLLQASALVEHDAVLIRVNRAETRVNQFVDLAVFDQPVLREEQKVALLDRPGDLVTAAPDVAVH